MYKIEIYPYSADFPRIFEAKKKRILKAVENCEVYHIGSTAVPGLGGKGILDIMIAIKNWEKAQNVVKELKKIGFTHIHPEENNRIFLSNKKKTGIADTHIHLLKKGRKEYKELLTFRDYMRAHPEQIKNLYNLKLEWCKKVSGDRIKYNKLKSVYVKDVLGQA